MHQQIENLTIEPKISADAVEMHPAVAFGAVILGAALFGVAGAFVAVPIAALLLSLVEIYSRTYDVLPQLGESGRERRQRVGCLTGTSPSRRTVAQPATSVPA